MADGIHTSAACAEVVMIAELSDFRAMYKRFV